MDLLNRIDGILKSRNMSRRRLAALSGVSPSTLQTAFTRNGDLSVDNIKKIAKALNMSVDELIKTEMEINVFGESMVNPFWSVNLENILKTIGYGLHLHEDKIHAEYYLWITKPNGKEVEVSDEQLKNLYNDVHQFLLFKLSQIENAQGAKHAHKK